MTHVTLNHIRVFLELIFVAYKLVFRIETRRSFTTGNSEFVLFSTTRSQAGSGSFFQLLTITTRLIFA